MGQSVFSPIEVTLTFATDYVVKKWGILARVFFCFA